MIHSPQLPVLTNALLVYSAQLLDVLTHVVQRYAPFPLQDRLSLVAYVDVQLVNGRWFVSLCEPRASAREVLRSSTKTKSPQERTRRWIQVDQ